MNQRFEAGQFITFTYNPPARDIRARPGLQTPPASDRSKEILVLHPNWHGKVHGIDMKRLTPAEGQVLRAIMDPETKRQVDAGQWPVEGAPPYPLIRDILSRMEPVELIKNPVAFYQQLVKPFIRDKDCYRQYNPQYVFGVRVIEESRVQGQVTNPAPAFGKPLFGSK
jgi:hypothetical protein